MIAHAPRARLHLVPHDEGDADAVQQPAAPAVEAGDLVLLGLLLAISAVPLLGEALGLDFGGGTLGASALLALLSGRELLSHLREHLRAGPWKTP